MKREIMLVCWYPWVSSLRDRGSANASVGQEDAEEKPSCGTVVVDPGPYPFVI